MEITKEGEGDNDQSNNDPLLEMKKVVRERKRMIMVIFFIYNIQF